MSAFSYVFLVRCLLCGAGGEGGGHTLGTHAEQTATFLQTIFSFEARYSWPGCNVNLLALADGVIFRLFGYLNCLGELAKCSLSLSLQTMTKISERN